ncbi:hypothetical protein EW146_g9866 [Bondarzewia mesenterica]|uniref:Uncharacterized protein n=1 Tax=Bondarzewia mesenterica TaxID=1095465 RepID=A0A4S4L7F9_9AGAM|nr:hypothetical protein EW146_g9866 [Bondarzewia mesenterica]
MSYPTTSYPSQPTTSRSQQPSSHGVAPRPTRGHQHPQSLPQSRITPPVQYPVHDRSHQSTVQSNRDNLYSPTYRSNSDGTSRATPEHIQSRQPAVATPRHSHELKQSDSHPVIQPRGINGPPKRKRYDGENAVYRLPVAPQTGGESSQSRMRGGDPHASTGSGQNEANNREHENVYGVHVPENTFWTIEQDLRKWKERQSPQRK